MQRYAVAKKLGDGTYGEVLRAVNKQTGEVVAVKRMKKKYFSWDDCMALREVQSLRKLRHPNVIKLKEIVLHMIFEHMECNLYEFMKDRRKHFPEAQLQSIFLQMVQGLAYMHNNGYFHRDMKPENVLINKDITKIADLGLAREIRSKPPYTEYVSTRWYRAPEILLRAKDYSAPADMFAVGCIVAELYMLRPLFPGNNETDMIHKLCQVLGTPTADTWRDGMRLAQVRRLKFPHFAKVPLAKLMPQACPAAISLVDHCLAWDPQQRCTAGTALKHDFFQVTAKPAGGGPATDSELRDRDHTAANPLATENASRARKAPQDEEAPLAVGLGGSLPPVSTRKPPKAITSEPLKPAGPPSAAQPSACGPVGFQVAPDYVPGPMPADAFASAPGLPMISARRQGAANVKSDVSVGETAHRNLSFNGATMTEPRRITGAAATGEAAAGLESLKPAVAAALPSQAGKSGLPLVVPPTRKPYLAGSLAGLRDVDALRPGPEPRWPKHNNFKLNSEDGRPRWRTEEESTPRMPGIGYYADTEARQRGAGTWREGRGACEDIMMPVAPAVARCPGPGPGAHYKLHGARHVAGGNLQPLAAASMTAGLPVTIEKHNLNSSASYAGGSGAMRAVRLDKLEKRGWPEAGTDVVRRKY